MLRCYAIQSHANDVGRWAILQAGRRRKGTKDCPEKVCRAGHTCTASTHHNCSLITHSDAATLVVKCRLKLDANAWHVAQLIAYSAGNVDTIAAQIHMRAVPVLEGTCDSHAALHPKLA